MTALTYTAEYLQSHAYMAQVFCEESHIRFQREPEACSEGTINHMQEYFNANNTYKRCHYAPNFPSWAVLLTIRLIKH